MSELPAPPPSADSPVPPVLAVPLVPPVDGARLFRRERSVRLGDVSPGGRLRLDALVRYLQDVSDDDTRDVGLADGGWVVRRTVVQVNTAAVYRENLQLNTWCSGIGGRWAERRVSMLGVAAHVEAAVLWVCIDPTTMRPTRLDARFLELYGPSTGGRTVSSRLLLDNPPPAAGPGEPWPLRFTDFDAFRHVNNAAVWEVLEEQLARRRHLRAPLRALVEHRLPIEQGDEVHVLCADSDSVLQMWLVLADGRVAVAAAVSLAPRG